MFPKLLSFSILFILFTAIGTFLHELAHYTTAKYFGYEASLHYASVSIYKPDQLSTDRSEYKELKYKRLLIKASGPIQTMVTGIIGLAILWFRHRRNKSSRFSAIDWFGVFLSLFWLRFVFNPLYSITSELVKPNGKLFGGDEAAISRMLDLHPWLLPISLGLIGLSICIWLIFKLIPIEFRSSFILSGLIGSTLGWLFWRQWLGPILLP